MSDIPANVSKPEVTPPRTINLAAVALLVEALAWIGAAVVLHVQKTAVTNYFWSNATHKVKGKTVHYQRSNPSDVHSIASQVANSQKGAISQAVILTLALVLLAYMLRRTRGATAARWSVVIVSVLTLAPLGVLAAFGGGTPSGTKIVQVIEGLASIAAIVLLFVPESRQYFTKIREATNAAQPAGGRRGLFAPRLQSASTLPKDVNPRRSPLTSSAQSRAQVRLQKAADNRQRTEAKAVAKGAALARSRAKAAAKNRRMEDDE